MSEGEGMPMEPAMEPYARFCDELDELVDKWRDKPEDDRLTHAEVVGALEYAKFKLLGEAGP